ncbi:MAG TPA: hypothetical protein VF815_00375 [Myxococcaceae bacterium]
MGRRPLMGGSPVSGSYRRLMGVVVLLGAVSVRAEAPEASAPPRSLPAWVRLLLPECPAPPVSAPALIEVLRTELRDDGVLRVDSGRVASGPEGGPQAYLRLTLPCEPAAPTATLRVEDATSLKAVERTMDFADLPPSARPRAIALGLAELLRAAWPWLVMLEPPLVSVPPGGDVLAEPPLPGDSSPATSPAPPGSHEPSGEAPPDPMKLLASMSPVALPEPPGPERDGHSPALHFSGKTLRFFDLGNLAWGGQVQGEYGRWALGAQLLAGSASTSQGKVALRLVTGTLGLTALELSSERFELRSGLRLTAGRASVNGTPRGTQNSGAQGAAPYFGATLSAGTRWWFSRAWACSVEAEAGYASGLIATVNGRETASLAGWLGGLSLGVSFSP